jgi:hypothetical protein
MVYGLAVVPTVFLADNTGLVLLKMSGHNPETLNRMSEKIASFAGVEAVDLLQPAVRPGPPAEPVPAA